MKEVLHKDPHKAPGLPVYLFSGAMAGAASVLVSNPLDVAKVRVQTSDIARRPIGFWSILLQVVRTEGNDPRHIESGCQLISCPGISGMAKGIGPRLCMAVPGSALTFVCYEIVKKLSLKQIDPPIL
jgi:hypothetical protein